MTVNRGISFHRSVEAVNCVMPHALLSNPAVLSQLVSRAYRRRDTSTSGLLRSREACEAAADLCQLCGFHLVVIQRICNIVEAGLGCLTHVSSEEFLVALRTALSVESTHGTTRLSCTQATRMPESCDGVKQTRTAVEELNEDLEVVALELERTMKLVTSEAFSNTVVSKTRSNVKACSHSSRVSYSSTDSFASASTLDTWSSEVAVSSPTTSPMASKSTSVERAALHRRTLALIRAYNDLLKSWRRGARSASESLVEVVFDASGGPSIGGTWVPAPKLKPLKARIAVPTTRVTGEIAAGTGIATLISKVNPVEKAMQLQGLDVVVRQVFNSGVYSEKLEVVSGSETMGDLLEGVHPSEALCTVFSGRQLCLCFSDGGLKHASEVLKTGGRLRITSIRPASVDVVYPPSGRREAIRIARIKASAVLEVGCDGNKREFPLRRSTGQRIGREELRASLYQKSLTQVDTMDLEEDWACPVCLGPSSSCGAVVALPCRHSFHRSCILPWLRRPGSLCPVGRCPVPGSCHLEMDFGLTGSAWRMLPEGVIAQDLPTTVQALIFEKRQLRPLTWTQVKKRRQALSRRFNSAPSEAFFNEILLEV